MARIAITTTLENALKHRTLFDAQQHTQQPTTQPTADQEQGRDDRRLKMARIICQNAANDHSRAIADKLSREWFNCDCSKLNQSTD